MIFHSANNLKRKEKEKEKEKKENKKKRKKRKRKRNKRKKKKKKRGHKIISINPHAIIVTWSIPFKRGQVLF